MELFEEIYNLIDMHQEGPYWDFKKEWYEKNKDEAEIAITDLSANRQQSKSVISKSKKDKYRGRS